MLSRGMLTTLHRPHQHVVAGRLGAPGEFRRLAGEQAHPRVVPVHPGAVKPRRPEEL